MLDMEHDIVEKLRRELREPISSERQVVYLLVEIRKLMEINGNGRSFPALKFACNWVAHPLLNRGEAIEIVKRIDKVQEIAEAPRDFPRSRQTDAACLKKAFRDLSFSNFRQELSRSLASHGVDGSITNDDANWANFLTYFAAVVKDCALECRAHGLKYVDRVEIDLVEALREPADQRAMGYQLKIQWRWKSKVTGERRVFHQYY